jgi:uncharacterized protein
VPTVGSVIELRRYPVKSLAGEILTVAAVDRRGVGGDRRWAVTDADGKFGSSKSTRRFRKMDGLLQLTASYDRDRNPIIGFPDGRRIPGDDPDVHEALSGHVGRPVQLLPEGRVSHFDEPVGANPAAIDDPPRGPREPAIGHGLVTESG